jgi:hypothetical protein
MWFIDSGFTVSTGAAVIKLKGYGTPILPKTSDFALIFNNNALYFLCSCRWKRRNRWRRRLTGTNGDYFPTTSGSSFTYQFVPTRTTGTVDTFSVNVAQGLVTIDTLSYAKFGTNIQDTFYFAKDAVRGIYYALSTVDFDFTYLFDSLPNLFITYPFLKENAAKGDKWTSPEYGVVKYNGKKGVARADFTVSDKNISYTVPGSSLPSYSNVIVMQRDIMFKEEGSTTFTVILSGKSYYAKNYGMIDQVFTGINLSLSLYKQPVIK